jgi:3-isopropylmalate/(R)-2-methylmalate dehydratase small subunit
LPAPTIDHLFQAYAHQETIVTTNLKKQVFSIEAGETREEIKFSLTDFDRALVEAGGWVEYADTRY